MVKHMRIRRLAAHETLRRPVTRSVATAYNGAGKNYAAYADGETEDLFSFAGIHGYADRQVWTVLDAKLLALKADGAKTVTFLDAGCGPGTWLCRLVKRARELGFTTINARGFDIAAVQVERARHKARELARLPGVKLKFDVNDLLTDLPESDASVDITICLYSVLSHLPVAALPKVFSEFGRVTRGYFITTVRAVGSTPTIFVDSAEKARGFKLDHAHNRCAVELRNGSKMDVPFHLFSSSELRVCAGSAFAVEDLYGLDIFHSRFAPDHRWNPDWIAPNESFLNRLEGLEDTFARNPAFIDHATHLMFVGRRKREANSRPRVSYSYSRSRDSISAVA